MATPKAFLCHSSADKLFVERLANDLRAGGVDAWFDRWEIKPGDSLRRKIDEGIGSATHFLALLSEASLRSEWVNTELDAALVLQISGHCVLIPVLLGITDSQVPVTLRGKKWVRFGDEYEDGLRELLNACHGVSERPPVAPTPGWVKQTALSSLGLTVHAQRLAALLSEHSSYGTDMEFILDVAEIRSALGIADEEIELAVDELNERGWIALLRDANSPLGFYGIGVSARFFLDTDSVLRGADVERDAAELAAAAVNTEARSIEELASHLRWDLRRANPAAYFLVDYDYAQGLPSNDLRCAFVSLMLKPKGRRLAAERGAPTAPAQETGGATPTPPAASNAPPEEKWVDPNYPADAGIQSAEDAAGYRVIWCRDDLLHRRLDIEGWELAVGQTREGRRCVFRLKDRPFDQTLIRKKKSP